jgi:hypothetical protein
MGVQLLLSPFELRFLALFPSEFALLGHRIDNVGVFWIFHQLHHLQFGQLYLLDMFGNSQGYRLSLGFNPLLPLSLLLRENHFEPIGLNLLGCLVALGLCLQTPSLPLKGKFMGRLALMPLLVDEHRQLFNLLTLLFLGFSA